MREQLEQTTEVLADPAGRTVALRFVTTVDGTTASGRRIRVEADGWDDALVGVVEVRGRPGSRRAELPLVDALPARHHCRPDGGGLAVELDLAS
jgi:hypothetical protein